MEILNPKLLRLLKAACVTMDGFSPKAVTKKNLYLIAGYAPSNNGSADLALRPGGLRSMLNVRINGILNPVKKTKSGVQGAPINVEDRIEFVGLKDGFSLGDDYRNIEFVDEISESIALMTKYQVLRQQLLRELHNNP